MAHELGPVTAIGFVRSAHHETARTPVQAALNPEETATVVVEAAFTDGLDGLEGFDYAWLLTWLGPPGLGQRDPTALRQVPLLLTSQPRELGIFATRGPRRVNPIGLSLVKILHIEGAEIHFGGVDLLDGTPVLDIKPFVGAFDTPALAARAGWFDQIDLPRGATPESLRHQGPSGSGINA